MFIVQDIECANKEAGKIELVYLPEGQKTGGIGFMQFCGNHTELMLVREQAITIAFKNKNRIKELILVDETEVSLMTLHTKGVPEIMKMFAGV